MENTISKSPDSNTSESNCNIETQQKFLNLMINLIEIYKDHKIFFKTIIENTEFSSSYLNIENKIKRFFSVMSAILEQKVLLSISAFENYRKMLKDSCWGKFFELSELTDMKSEFFSLNRIKEYLNIKINKVFSNNQTIKNQTQNKDSDCSNKNSNSGLSETEKEEFENINFIDLHMLHMNNYENKLNYEIMKYLFNNSKLFKQFHEKVFQFFFDFFGFLNMSNMVKEKIVYFPSKHNLVQRIIISFETIKEAMNISCPEKIKKEAFKFLNEINMKFSKKFLKIFNININPDSENSDFPRIILLVKDLIDKNKSQERILGMLELFNLKSNQIPNIKTLILNLQKNKPKFNLMKTFLKNYPEYLGYALYLYLVDNDTKSAAVIYEENNCNFPEIKHKIISRSKIKFLMYLFHRYKNKEISFFHVIEHFYDDMETIIFFISKLIDDKYFVEAYNTLKYFKFGNVEIYSGILLGHFYKLGLNLISMNNKFSKEIQKNFALLNKNSCQNNPNILNSNTNNAPNFDFLNNINNGLPKITEENNKSKQDELMMIDNDLAENNLTSEANISNDINYICKNNTDNKQNNFQLKHKINSIQNNNFNSSWDRFSSVNTLYANKNNNNDNDHWYNKNSREKINYAKESDWNYPNVSRNNTKNSDKFSTNEIINLCNNEPFNRGCNNVGLVSDPNFNPKSLNGKSKNHFSDTNKDNHCDLEKFDGLKNNDNFENLKRKYEKFYDLYAHKEDQVNNTHDDSIEININLIPTIEDNCSNKITENYQEQKKDLKSISQFYSSNLFIIKTIYTDISTFQEFISRLSFINKNNYNIRISNSSVDCDNFNSINKSEYQNKQYDLANRSKISFKTFDTFSNEFLIYPFIECKNFSNNNLNNKNHNYNKKNNNFDIILHNAETSQKAKNNFICNELRKFFYFFSENHDLNYSMLDVFAPSQHNFIKLPIGEEQTYFINDLKKFEFIKQKFFNSFYFGIDMEWRSKISSLENNYITPSIIQISDGQVCAIIDYVRLSKDEYFIDDFIGYFSAKIFIGFSFHNDIKMIDNKKMKEFFILRKVIDLEIEYKKYYELKSLSLSQLTKKIYQKNLCKIEQTSNWNLRPLRKSQLHYSALDAYILVDLYKKLQILIDNHH